MQINDTHYESEKTLEENLIKHLQADGYELVSIPDVEALEANFRKQINKHNAVELGGPKYKDFVANKMYEIINN